MTENKKTFATPKVRKFARELGANIDQIKGTVGNAEEKEAWEEIKEHFSDNLDQKVLEVKKKFSKNTKVELKSPEEIELVENVYYKKGEHSTKVIVGPSESMSKSKKNVIDPENIMNNYGADSVRLFILSDSPPEKDIQWSDTGVASSNKFLQKI